MNKFKIYIASDHAGLALKEKIKKYFDKNNIDFLDYGPYSYNKEDDYPDYIKKVAMKISKSKEGDKGIILGFSGQGEAICANKYKGVRAIEYYGKNIKIVKLGRMHNDANILSLGAGFLNEKQAISAIKIFLLTPFSNEERHKRRIKKIE